MFSLRNLLNGRNAGQPTKRTYVPIGTIMPVEEAERLQLNAGGISTDAQELPLNGRPPRFVKLRAGEWALTDAYIPRWLSKGHFLLSNGDIPVRILTFRRHAPVSTFVEIVRNGEPLVVPESAITAFGLRLIVFAISLIAVPGVLAYDISQGRIFQAHELYAPLLSVFVAELIFLKYWSWWAKYDVITTKDVELRRGWINIGYNAFQNTQIKRLSRDPKGRFLLKTLWTFLDVGHIRLYEQVEAKKENGEVNRPIHSLENVPNSVAVYHVILALTNAQESADAATARNTAYMAALYEAQAIGAGVSLETIAALRETHGLTVAPDEVY